MSAPVLSWLLITQRKSIKTNSQLPAINEGHPSHRREETASTFHVDSNYCEPQTSSPKSQSFSRSYGPNLPTSLTYIITSTRGYSPWRPDAVMSTATALMQIIPRLFMDRRERTRQTRRSSALPSMKLHLGISPFHRFTTC